MTFGRIVGIVLLCVSAAIWSGCERRPLVDPGSGHYVRVYVDTEVQNYTCGFYDREGQRVHPRYQAPEVMRVMLCDRTTGRQVQNATCAIRRATRTAGSISTAIYLPSRAITTCWHIISVPKALS